MIPGFAWAELARCRGRIDLYFAPPNEPSDLRDAREEAAKRLCLTCPVLLACRSHARAYGESGIWGGETEEERRAWRRGTGTHLHMRSRRRAQRAVRGSVATGSDLRLVPDFPDEQPTAG